MDNKKTIARFILSVLSVLTIAIPTVLLSTDLLVYATCIGLYVMFSAGMLLANRRLSLQFGAGTLGAVCVSGVIGAISPGTVFGLLAFLSAFIAVVNEVVGEKLFNGLTVSAEALTVVDDEGEKVEVATAQQLVDSLAKMNAEQIYNWVVALNPEFAAYMDSVFKSVETPAANPSDGTATLVQLMNLILSVKATDGNPLNPLAIRWLFDKLGNLMANPKQTPQKGVIVALEKVAEVYAGLPADKQKVKPESPFAPQATIEVVPPQEKAS